jgi:5-methylcytosine-specific restriction endonuclease McrA
VLLRDNYQCQMCGAVVHGKLAHVDHIVPKSKGGSDEVSNLRCLCVSCHSKHEGWRATNVWRAKTFGQST